MQPKLQINDVITINSKGRRHYIITGIETCGDKLDLYPERCIELEYGCGGYEYHAIPKYPTHGRKRFKHKFLVTRCEIDCHKVEPKHKKKDITVCSRSFR